MSSFKVVVTDQVLPDVELERSMLVGIDASLEVADGTVEDVIGRGADADALLNTYFPMSASTLEALANCRIVARYGIGVDNVDLEAAAARGIVVTNVPDYGVQEVASHALALMLTLLRRVAQGDALVRSGGWSIDNLRPIRRLSGLTAGLVGYGKIARRFAGHLREQGMDLLVYDPYVDDAGPGAQLVDLDELLRGSDVVSVHAPLTPETEGLIDRESIASMADGAVLINTSRGGTVVLDDVLDALRDGSLAGAALDVFDQEPLDASRIDGVPNLVVTPHMAYYSEQALEEMQRKATTQVIKVLTGEEPDYRVN